MNPYKPSVHFMGHKQTLQNVASDPVLHCLLTDLDENVNYSPTTLKFEMDLSI